MISFPVHGVKWWNVTVCVCVCSVVGGFRLIAVTLINSSCCLETRAARSSFVCPEVLSLYTQALCQSSLNVAVLLWRVDVRLDSMSVSFQFTHPRVFVSRSLLTPRQAWCCLQVKLCDPCLSALCVRVPWCDKALYKYSSFPFLYTRWRHQWRHRV